MDEAILERLPDGVATAFNATWDAVGAASGALDDAYDVLQQAARLARASEGLDLDALERAYYAVINAADQAGSDVDAVRASAARLLRGGEPDDAE